MAIQFSTNGDSLANAAGAATIISSQSPMSISAWLNTLWDGDVKTSSFVGLYNSSGGSAAIQIGCRTTAGQCTVWTWNGGIIVASTGIVLPASEWVNITFTYDGTTARLYINGVLNNSAAYAAAAANLNQVFLNGYSTGATSETATFQTDTYDLYNRALSADEVLTIFNSRGSRHGIVQGALLRYEFDEGVVGAEATTVYNQSVQLGAEANNLVSNSTRTPRALFASGWASQNLRPPIQ